MRAPGRSDTPGVQKKVILHDLLQVYNKFNQWYGDILRPINFEWITKLQFDEIIPTFIEKFNCFIAAVYDSLTTLHSHISLVYDFGFPYMVNIYIGI